MSASTRGGPSRLRRQSDLSRARSPPCLGRSMLNARDRTISFMPSTRNWEKRSGALPMQRSTNGQGLDSVILLSSKRFRHSSWAAPESTLSPRRPSKTRGALVEAEQPGEEGQQSPHRSRTDCPGRYRVACAVRQTRCEYRRLQSAWSARHCSALRATPAAVHESTARTDHRHHRSRDRRPLELLAVSEATGLPGTSSSPAGRCPVHVTGIRPDARSSPSCTARRQHFGTEPMTLTRISDAWFPYRGRSRPTVRLFCLPFAGAGASSFAPLAPAGRHSRGLCGAVAGAREPHAGALHRLGGGPGCGTRVLDAGTHGLSVRNSRLQHGASIALELCRRLRGGILPQPVALFVVGAPGPRVPKRPRSRASPRAVRRRASPARWYIAGDPRELGTPRHISSCPARRLRPERIIRLQSTGAPLASDVCLCR